jgi:hypothetical protein
MDLRDDDVPMLVENGKGSIALLVKHDKDTMYPSEADALIIVANDSLLKAGEYVRKLNLDYWRPYTGKVTLQNLDAKK